MSDYRIEKSRWPVVVKTHSGETVAGEMFLQPHGRPDGGAERPIDILNAAEPFFPLALPDGEMVLLAKSQVLEVATESTDEVADEVPLARPALIEVRLASGDTHAGAVFLELPSDHPRLLDFLNRAGQRFFTLHGTDRRLLISRQALERVRPLD